MERSDAKNDWQMTVYVPKELREEDPIGRLERLAKKRQRSINFLVLEAIERYLDQPHPELADL